MNELNTRMSRVLVGIPNTGSIRIETMTSLINMLLNSPVEYSLYTPISCYVHMNREEIVKVAIKTGADYILFVDTDMKFPDDALNKMLSLDVEIVGAHYHLKKYPPTSVVIQLDPPLDKLPETPIKVRALGTGLMLVKVDVFKKMRQPWFFFQPEIVDDSFTVIQKAVGEDVWFCDRARELGYDVWLEPSIVAGHIGEAVF